MTNEIDILVVRSLAIVADAQRDPAKYQQDTHQKAYAYAADIVRQVADNVPTGWMK